MCWQRTSCANKVNLCQQLSSARNVPAYPFFATHVFAFKKFCCVAKKAGWQISGWARLLTTQVVGKLSPWSYSSLLSWAVCNSMKPFWKIWCCGISRAFLPIWTWFVSCSCCAALLWHSWDKWRVGGHQGPAYKVEAASKLSRAHFCHWLAPAYIPLWAEQQRFQTCAEFFGIHCSFWTTSTTILNRNSTQYSIHMW